MASLSSFARETAPYKSEADIEKRAGVRSDTLGLIARRADGRAAILSSTGPTR